MPAVKRRHFGRFTLFLAGLVTLVSAGAASPLRQEGKAAFPGNQPVISRFLATLMQSHAVQSLTPTGMAQLLKKDPQAILAFVRDGIRFEPYRGSLKGAQGALVSGSGNAYDQALLLKEMLEASGMRCILLRGRLPRNRCEELVRSMRAAPDRLANFLDDDDLQSLHIDSARWQSLTADARAREDTLISAALDAARQTVATRLPQIGSADGHFAAAVEATEDYLWVQATGGEALVDMHPCFPAGFNDHIEPLGVALYATSLPDELKHWVRLRLFAETKGETGGERSVVLDYRALPSALTRRTVTLHLVPESATGTGPRRLNVSLRSGDMMLMSGRMEFPSAGGMPEKGGLTGLWLEVTLLSPNEAPRLETLTLLDTVTPGQNWSQRIKAVSAATPTAVIDKLWIGVDLFLGWPGQKPGIYLESVGRFLRRGGIAARASGRTVNEAVPALVQFNPTFMIWGDLYNRALAQAFPAGNVAFDAPVVLAALHRYGEAGERIQLNSQYRVLFLRSEITAAVGRESALPGVLAAELLDRIVAAGKGAGETLDSSEPLTAPFVLAQGNIEKELAGARGWDWQSVAELGFDRLRKATVFAVGGGMPAWWRIEAEGHDPCLRGRDGWQVSVSANAASRPTTALPGELARCLPDRNDGNWTTDALIELMRVWLSRFHGPWWSSPFTLAATASLGADAAPLYEQTAPVR